MTGHHRVVRVRLTGALRLATPSLLMLRTETTDDPAQIARQPRMVSVNSALQVDLFAQADVSTVVPARRDR
jgi:acyl-CoA hydrolase